MNEDDVLAYDPFEGDFGSPNDRILKDKLGIARKPGPCPMCATEIQPKETIRMRTEIVDDELMSFRWCQKCCEAMEAFWHDDGDAVENRELIRLSNDRTGVLP